MNEVLAQPRTVDTRTLRTAYVDRGARAPGTPLLLLHGGGLDRRMWADQLAAFPGRRVVVPDARGHGGSGAADAPHRLCDDLVALLDELGIDRAILVGLSMGAGTAVDVALEHPGRVAGVVVSGAGTSEPDFCDPWVLDVLATWQRTQAAADAEGWIEAFLRFLPGPHRAMADVDPEVRRRVEQMVRDTLAQHLTTDASGTPVPPTPPTPVADTWARLPGLALPVLAVVGALDADDHLRMARTLAETVPDGRVVSIDGTAHYPNLERVAEFNAAVAEFLAARGL